MIRYFLLLLSAQFLLANPLMAGEEEKTAAYEPMTVFAELAGKVWRGEGKGPNSKPIIDIAVYEMILGGRAFQSTHKLEGGTYGGRTIFFYDEGNKEYIFHYFTTAGFHTTGTMAPIEDGFTVIEKVNGHDEIAQVQSDMMVVDGVLQVLTSHVTHDGNSSAGDTLAYREVKDPDPSFFDEADALFGKRSKVKQSHGRYDEN